MLTLPSRRGLLGADWTLEDVTRIAEAMPALWLSPRVEGSWRDRISGTDLTTFSRANTSPTYELDGAGGLVGFSSGQRAIGVSPETGIRGGSIFGQRTQLLTGTEDLSSGLAPINATRNLNVIAAPNGTITADNLIETTANGLHSQEVADHVFVANTTYTFSCFAKSIGGRSFCPGFPTIFGSARFGRFDLSGNGSVLSADAGVTAAIEPYADGWYRCHITSTVGATGGGARVGLFIGNGTSINYTGDTSKGMYVWGWNLYSGSVRYPYIGGAITCPADVLTIDGTNFSRWFDTTGMVILARFSNGNIATSATDSFIFDFSNSSNTAQRFSSRIGVQSTTRGTMRSFVNTGSSFEYAVDSGIYANGTNGKIAIRCGPTNDFAVSFNGSAEVVDAIGSVGTTLSSFNQLRIGDQSFVSAPFNGYIHDLLGWPSSSPAGQRLQQLSAAL